MYLKEKPLYKLTASELVFTKEKQSMIIFPPMHFIKIKMFLIKTEFIFE